MEATWLQQRAGFHLLHPSRKFSSCFVLMLLLVLQRFIWTHVIRLDLRFSDTTKHILVHRRGM
jgi:hypothetical protein